MSHDKTHLDWTVGLTMNMRCRSLILIVNAIWSIYRNLDDQYTGTWMINIQGAE